MKLYSNRFAPSPRRVRIYCAEKGLPLELVDVDIGAGETQRPGYLAVNPLGELPTLVLDDGARLTESVAICRYLEELHPEPPLFGLGAAERYEVNRWIDRLLVRMYVPTTHVFRHTHAFWKERMQQNSAWGESQRTVVLAEHAALDARLADREHVAGGGFSMADIVAFTTLEFGKPSNLRAGPEHPHLLRWYEAVRARPSAKA
jgi:glutathione S-transferase